ncbi:MAG: hypothetical protein KGN01_08210 [Patescibacteria group bacterium]|nr:hypothetical protein [Patescibacteria group bacterium]
MTNYESLKVISETLATRQRELRNLKREIEDLRRDAMSELQESGITSEQIELMVLALPELRRQERFAAFREQRPAKF